MSEHPMHPWLRADLSILEIVDTEAMPWVGAFDDEHGAHRAGTWLRYPAGARHTPRMAGGCRIYVRKGHLAAPPPGGM